MVQEEQEDEGEAAEVNQGATGVTCATATSVNTSHPSSCACRTPSSCADSIFYGSTPSNSTHYKTTTS